MSTTRAKPEMPLQPEEKCADTAVNVKENSLAESKPVTLVLDPATAQLYQTLVKNQNGKANAAEVAKGISLYYNSHQKPKAMSHVLFAIKEENVPVTVIHRRKSSF